jgi:hypothetical protein
MRHNRLTSWPTPTLRTISGAHARAIRGRMAISALAPTQGARNCGPPSTVAGSPSPGSASLVRSLPPSGARAAEAEQGRVVEPDTIEGKLTCASSPTVGAVALHLAGQLTGAGRGTIGRKTLPGLDRARRVPRAKQMTAQCSRSRDTAGGG